MSARVVKWWRDIAFYIFAATIVTGLLAFLGYGIVYKAIIVKGNVIPGLLLRLFFLGADALITLQAYTDAEKSGREGSAFNQSSDWPNC